MQSIFNSFIIALSLCTATGVFVHDTRIDQAASTSILKRTTAKKFTGSTDIGVSGDPHTHPHRSGKTLGGFTYKVPGHPPREDRHRKHLSHAVLLGGRHAFDNSLLPIIG